MIRNNLIRWQRIRRPGRIVPACALGAAFLLLTIGATGCHRGYYRRQADSDARTLIREKLNDPRWCQIDPSIDTSPESRMFDPFSADHPPLPPDDPASHDLMHCVDGKEGYPNWHANGDTSYVSNPEWRSYLPMNEQGILELNLEKAIQLSLIHSTDWQQQRETLYLSALEVSLERFGFDSQAFFGWNSFFRTQGRLAPGGTRSSVELGPGSNRTQIERLGTTGANFAVGIANTVIWNFSGADSQTASTLIDFSLIQPLLRRAGRDRIMESLTQAERTLLANVRQLEHYRRGFHLSIVTGRSPGAGPNASGSFLSEPGGASTSAGGYLGLLLDQQQIRISEFNVQSLQNVLNQFREFFTEERINLLQVRSAETSLYDAQSSLLVAKVTYKNSLDQFKRDLGLPPDVPVEIVDPFLDTFNLIDDQLLQRQIQINNLRGEIGNELERIIPPTQSDAGELVEVQWSEELKTSLQALPDVIKRVQPIFQAIRDEDIPLVREDFETFRVKRIDRIRKLDELREFVASSGNVYEIEPSILQETAVESVGRLENELGELLVRFGNIESAVAVLNENITRLINEGAGLSSSDLAERLNTDVLFEAPEILTRVANVAIELNLLQARARVDSITLSDVEITAEAAFAIACQFRRDLMNARATLVDQWRRIEFVADDLESTLDVVFEGSVGSVGDNPFRIRWENNRFGAGIRFDAPITRLAERNVYRRALIDYQQARRQYYSVEDSINQNLRRTIRAMEQSRVLFELNRRSIQTAIQRVELSQSELVKPQPPGAGGVNSALGPTAASDLTGSINSLQSAQSQFVNVWVSYEVLRRGLDFDMGTMRLTPDGMWLDPGTINVAYAWRAAEALGIAPEEINLPPTRIPFRDDPMNVPTMNVPNNDLSPTLELPE